jgi:hypothetical protein
MKGSLARSLRPEISLRDIGGLGCAVALAAVLIPSSADGAITLGQTFVPNTSSCFANTTSLQTQTPGGEYRAPTAGVITGWSYQPGATIPQLKFKVGRTVPGSDLNMTTNLMVVAESGVISPVPGMLNSYPARIPVQSGDFIGLYFVTQGDCIRFPGSAAYVRHWTFSDVSPGTTASFDINPNAQMDVSAVLEPDADGDGFGDESQDRCPAGPGPIDGCPPNTFSFGKVKRNKQTGTATLTVDVSGPGTLLMTGKGLVKQRPGGTDRAAQVAARTVSAAGKVKLRVKSKGKKKRKLNRTGNVKVRAKVTYTPTGGEPNTKAKRIKLTKKL